MNCQTLFLDICQMPLIAKARTDLRNGLSPELKYHSAEHTDDVLKEAILFASTDGLSNREIEILCLAAAYHDIGFVTLCSENEELGAKMLLDSMLATAQYSEAECQLAYQMIVDTRVRELNGGPQQVPSTKLSKYLCDADVSNLGRLDFFEKAELLRAETKMEEREFYVGYTLKFMESHRWHTPAALKLRQEQKGQNVSKIKSRWSL